jgi:hypothetical protein
MSQLPGPSTSAAAPLSTRTENAVEALAFHLDYLDDKLTAIGSTYAEDISAEHAHDLHSAWDQVRQARVTLDRLRARPTTDPPSARRAPVIDFEAFTARWDRANEPISELLRDKTARTIAEWAAARARYELAFVEAMRPVAMDSSGRVARLREAEVELDRACKALSDSEPTPATSPVERPRRRARHG